MFPTGVLLRATQGHMGVRVQRETAAPPVFGKENAANDRSSDGFFVLPGLHYPWRVSLRSRSP